jgi:pyruvate/2-oxoglutarate/acetoin dehydrogenase E1 component
MNTRLEWRRPTSELMLADFAGACFDRVVNQLAEYRCMIGGRASLSDTIRLVKGAGESASRHSPFVESRRLDRPGPEIVGPGSSSDADGLVRAAVRCGGPVQAGA